eukprot:CAMPEP_0177447108 /NCGR_PEP_ID=MMETSP0369-20130122/7449_1 /TAXON_ID=447022 ORGANISM="Scrippsiella hangoei-like, Strain SHHI-4" /NCGR_SAMPLE_ID=MMETSP0369 /ASSEMBLY_ACC=CAM_ASM_000364 /LENGTH=90 /DNA_ID=CAMNT_0018919393 /DNA_START=56 /DNA_END=328 /DNA_ORIENTATION=+
MPLGRFATSVAVAAFLVLLTARANAEATSNASEKSTETETLTDTGPGQQFGKAVLIIAMTLFFTLIIGLTILDKVLARRRKNEPEADHGS